MSDIRIEMDGDQVLFTQDLAPILDHVQRRLREEGDEAIRQLLIDNGIVVVKRGREPLEWAIEEMGDCEPGYGWCWAHSGYLPSNRKPPYCDDVLDIVDKIERYVS